MRTFETGATRSEMGKKLEYKGFLSPQVLKRYAKYMRSHQIQEDGVQREAANWKKGMSQESYADSAIRHMMDWWIAMEEGGETEELCCAILFNVQGYLHEQLKRNSDPGVEQCGDSLGTAGVGDD